ncbi:hypothetical protein Q8A73_003910 [Channa argus]|nr:hypothetical protein Q8A73_003910 [Channa argus]
MNLSLNSSLPIPTCGDYSPVYLSSRTAAYTINVVLGLPINCYIMRRIVTGAVEMTPSEFFTANLVVSELLACLGCVFNILFSITNSLWMIDLCIFFDSFLYFSRPLFLTLMSVERYLAVLQPVVFLRWKPLRALTWSGPGGRHRQKNVGTPAFTTIITECASLSATTCWMRLTLKPITYMVFLISLTFNISSFFKTKNKAKEECEHAGEVGAEVEIVCQGIPAPVEQVGLDRPYEGGVYSTMTERWKEGGKECRHTE